MTNGTSRKPQPDVYTLMLVLALLAIIIGTVFLYLETKDYGSPPYKGASSDWGTRAGSLLAGGFPGCGGHVALGDGPIHA